MLTRYRASRGTRESSTAYVQPYKISLRFSHRAYRGTIIGVPTLKATKTRAEGASQVDINHSPATPDLPTGPEGVKGVVSMFRSGMPDLRVVVEDMIAEGDKVATRYTLEGTYEGELFGVPPTGQQLSIKSMSVERVSDGKIREHWRISDSLEMMQQLGMIPIPEHA